MLKKISLLVIGVFMVSQSQAKLIIGCHSGTNCFDPTPNPIVYNCWGTGAEEPDLLLLSTAEKIDKKIVKLVATDRYFMSILKPFATEVLQDIVVSVENLDFNSPIKICENDSLESCMEIKKNSINGELAEFILSVTTGELQNSTSFKCFIKK